MKESWALVFGGGGGKGAYQIGVWKALKEAQIENRIEAISGASVGALNAVLFGIGDYDLAMSIWSSISPAQFLSWNFSKEKVDKKINVSLFSRSGLSDLLENHLPSTQLKQAKKWIYANASKKNQHNEWETTYFSLNHRSKEEICQILLASSAIPYIYQPIPIQGDYYQDGGLTDDLPVYPLYQMGYRHFIVVSLTQKERIPPALFPEAQFIEIFPQESIGEIWDGVLDFSPKSAKTRMEIGYENAQEILQNENNLLKCPEESMQYLLDK
ncbi:hypothetical protein FACS189418_6190 [Clostridia bacterium]|nr:hypothetical protein FACS189418_6190 [Clostridia bacterium]